MSWTDPEFERFRAVWQRRGELMAAAGLTGLFTWLAAALPSASQTHVDIWPPIGVAGALGLAGLYVLIAVEAHKGWLPGRKKIEKGELGRAMVQSMDEMMRTRTPSEYQVRLANNRPVPLVPPVTYQVAALKQAIPAIAEAYTEFDVMMLNSVLGLMHRPTNPIFEPLRGSSCVEGLAKLVQDGTLVQIEPTTWRIVNHFEAKS